MSSTEFDSTRTPRAGTPTSATRIIAAALALAALGVAVVVGVSQARTHHATAVVLVDSSGPVTTASHRDRGEHHQPGLYIPQPPVADVD